MHSIVVKYLITVCVSIVTIDGTVDLTFDNGEVHKGFDVVVGADGKE